MNQKLPTLSKIRKKQLKDFLDFLESESVHFMGYPCSGVYNYDELLPLLRYSINNIGDPYLPSNYHLNTHSFECEILSYFKRLTHAKEPTWGYVTNGGTEGNLYGLYAARERFNNQAVAYYSEDSHYSINKNMHLLNLNSKSVGTTDNGEIDYQAFEKWLIKDKAKKVIISVNLGTTMKGAVDDVSKIKAIFKKLAINEYYIHADAAFFGMVLPFLRPKVAFGFETGIDSIAISGHKMIGSPIPCGICLVKEKYVHRLTRDIEYIGTLDKTITGSRNGITPMFLWYFVNTSTEKTISKHVQKCFDNADYILQKFKALNINAWRNPHSFIVVFDKCAPNLLSRWQIAVNGNNAHIIPMPHINREIIDDFFNDLIKEGQTVEVN